MNKLIYGKDATERVVSVEVADNFAEIFRELPDGTVLSHIEPHNHWIVYSEQYSPKFDRLDGDLHYKWIVEYPTREKYEEVIQGSYKKRYDFYTARDPKTNFMLRSGVTYFKDMKVSDVSVLSFDIESTGLTHDKKSKVLLISNTLRKAGRTVKRLFSVDEYESDGQMLEAWCAWVREVNPSVICGHYILGYDLPYMAYCASRYGLSLDLGRDGSAIEFDEKARKIRKDGSQSYDYFNAKIFGREIIDTKFLAIKYDIQRKYPSYSLKEIIRFEGLEKKNRQFYDASTIKDNWDNPVEREKIKAYAIDDADDSLALYDLMIPSFFYYAQHIPMSFQEINNTATGTQINNFMIRAYLQGDHSLPKASPAKDFEGAISFGVPGIYRNVAKVDVASLYPSIMREFQVCDRDKDPKGYFLEMVNYFTEERLSNKQKAKETGNRYYKDLEQSQKIVINSAYGFLGATGLLFNSPDKAAFVTEKGREIIRKGILWASGHEVVAVPKKKKKETDKQKYRYKLGPKVAEGKGYTIVNADTDSFSYEAPSSDYKRKGFTEDITELNSLFPEKIRWENDGIFKRVVVAKTKNYVLDNGKEVVIKGSALKATMKEKALKQFIQDTIQLMLEDKKDHLFHLYHKYAKDCLTVRDIGPWCFKRTITKSILNPKRTNEQRILDAIQGEHVDEGDKVLLFFKSETEYCLKDRFSGEYDKDTLLSKLHKTLKVFGKLIKVDLYPNYSLEKNRKLLGET